MIQLMDIFPFQFCPCFSPPYVLKLFNLKKIDLLVKLYRRDRLLSEYVCFILVNDQSIFILKYHRP
jgi:hypothetical protein